MSSIFRPFKIPLVIKRHQTTTSLPRWWRHQDSRNVKFYITNHLKPLYNRLLVLMHSAETAFRNRHDAPNVFPCSARPLLDAAYEWHNIISCGWLKFVVIIVVEMNFVDISHSAVSSFTWYRSITITSLCRQAAIRTCRLFSTCSWGILTVAELVYDDTSCDL